MRENVARYINHACRPNAESDVDRVSEGHHPHHQEHRAGWEIATITAPIVQSLSEADRLPVEAPEKKRKEEARGSPCQRNAAEGQGGAQGAEEGGKVGGQEA